MSTIRPFRALCPPAGIAAELASVPYDVIDTAEARALASDNERSFLHVVRPEINLPPEVGLYDDRVYEAGAAGLRRFIQQGWLEEREEPGLFLYRLERDGHAQTGVVGCCSVDEYDDGRIVKHERTRPDKEDDRTRHLLAQSAHAEPVFLAHAPSPAISRYLEAGTRAVPLYDFTAVDGVRHTVWDAPDAARITGLFAELPRIYVADGHHRSASASRARAHRRENNAAHRGDEDYNFFLAVVFPADQLRILAYNRVVRDLGAWTSSQFLERLSGVLRVEPGAPPAPPRRGEVSMYLDGGWHRVMLAPAGEGSPPPVATLDIARLQSQVLEPLLGIGDPRTDERIDFVGGSRGPEALVQRVHRGDAAVAFSMFPTSMEELMAVADAGEVMPPKSTWFEPKLRSGLFVHLF